jgi:acyl-CoA hydrolase
MDYQALYEAKRTTPERALDLVAEGCSIVIGSDGNQPMEFLTRLHTIAHRLNGLPVTLHGGGFCDPTPLPFLNDPACLGKIQLSTWFYMEQERRADPRMLSLLPVHLHTYSSRTMEEDPDIFVSVAAPMDEHGYLTIPFTLCHDFTSMNRAKKIILEVNPRAPRVHGMNQIHISDVTALYEVDYQPVLVPDPPLSPVDKEIGRLVATLVNDGDTIQLGIGSVPNAVGYALMDKKDLGVHTEMLTSVVAWLAENRVVTGKKKTLFPGKIVAAIIYGDQKLYDFVDDNPSIMMLPGELVNNPWVVAQNDNMVSINTCMQVDLVGQVASESIGSRQFSGSGGQNDTAEGAIHAKNGRSIIAVHATKKNDTISAIVPTLEPGAIVTLSRNNLDYVVTEFGIARLKYATVRQRAKALIGIAHPKFRPELQRRAIELGFCYPEDFSS